jgi:hypothetical protein
MQVSCSSCGKSVVLESSFDPENINVVWKEHGHYPGKSTFLCSCGSKLMIGPEVGGDSEVDILRAALALVVWYEKHQFCGAKAN